MQCTSELLTALSEQGMTVSLVGDKLKVVPRRLITDEFQISIGQHKSEIIEALKSGAGEDFCNATKGGGHVEPVTDESFTQPLDYIPLPPMGEVIHPPNEAEGTAPNSRSCFDCGYFDGKGSAWPGMCRYFETIGKPAKEIDSNVVDPLAGCKCFMALSVGAKADSLCLIKGGGETPPPLSFFQAKEDNPCLICGKPLSQDGGDCWHRAYHLGEVFPQKGVTLDDNSKLRAPVEDYPKMGSPDDSEKKTSPITSPAAVEWLAANRQRLRQYGWSASQLYRKNKSPGLIFSLVWSKPFLKVTILKSGSIEFEFIDGKKDCINVARPMPQRKLNQKKENK